ncbi:aldo/keto reductase [Streptomyces curacoi]|uniref:Oxidoreductase n=1 Tax=Streptomyces curacoi TaxID=146536 RepID=A0A124H0X7_9ACTN|nr:aldo/keto reductase [Streptomyces curacoi]KUM74550.1 oxidoreductase [Streptomyces curacoi]
MRYRTLGRQGPEVSSVCLGTWALSGFWGSRTEPAVEAVRRAFDLGVNFFDTAHAYGAGMAEAGLARGLGDLLRTRRSDIVISTKGGLELRGDGVVRNSDAGFLRANLTDSLRSLGTDYVDVFLVHWPDPRVPLAETAGALAGFVEEGLARYVGVSNFTVEEMAEFSSVVTPQVAQVPFNMLDRGIEKQVLPHCDAAGIGVMGWSALAHGVLAGALRPGQVFPPDDWRAYSPTFQGERFAKLLAAVDRLQEFAAERGHSVAQLALAWVLAHPSGVIPVIGAQLPEHLEDSVRAVDLDLDEAEMRALDELLADAPELDGSGDQPPAREERSV